MKKPFLNFILKTFLFLSFLFLNSSVFAYTTVSGTISANTTWTTGNTYYISANITLSSGYTLTIEPGTIVKFNTGKDLIINGVINSNGTSANHIIFTSQNDNSVGEVITGSTGNPAPKDWGNFKISGTGTYGSLLNYNEIRYGGDGYVTYGSTNRWFGLGLINTNTNVEYTIVESIYQNGIYINSNSSSESPSIHLSTIQNNTQSNIIINTGNPTIDDNSIVNSGLDGVNNYAGNPTIINNTITGNNRYGVKISDGTSNISYNNISNNMDSGIYLANGFETINGNTITNNGGYGIDSFNLEIKTTTKDVAFTNSISGNTQGQTAVRGFDITSSSGTIDGTTSDIIVIGGSALASGKTLNILAGSIFKVGATKSININGVIKANGSTSNHIIFTSINDQSVGSDALGTGTPNRKNWGNFDISGVGTYGSILDYTEIRYGGDGYVTYGSTNRWYGLGLINTNTIVQNTFVDNIYQNGIYINSNSSSESPTIQFSTIQDNTVSNVIINNGSPTFDNNNIINSGNDGINNYAGNPTITNNTITGNSRYGIKISDGISVIIGNNISNNIDSGIYLANGFESISSNTINNNGGYGIDSYNLEIKITPKDVAVTNTMSGNTLGQTAVRGFDITSTSGTVDGTTSDIIVIGGGALASGKTLNILAGSIFKVGATKSININGVINASGNSVNPIVFTSINDQSVGFENLGTGTPSANNWGTFDISGAGTYGSILDYVEIKYAGDGYVNFGGANRWYGLGLVNTNTIVKNSLVDYIYQNGVYIDSNSTSPSPTLKNNTIRNSTASNITMNRGYPNIYNNNLLYGKNGLYNYSGNPNIKNNIITGNSNYGINSSSGAPVIGYNLFYLNTTSPTNNLTLDGTNIVGLDPLFTGSTEYLSNLSPAINTGDPSFGNHPDSGNIYDIGRYEYDGYAPLVFTASISGISGRSLSYLWSVIQDPTNNISPPNIVNSSGSIHRDNNISCSLKVKKLGNYAIKIVIKDGNIIIGEYINSFNVTTP